MLAARAGARRVYAIEANPEAARRAREVTAAAEGVPFGTIEVIDGFSTAITLPERADLLVAEIVGSVASEEGLIQTMRDAQQRHLKRPFDPASYIPQRVQTLCAPASYILTSLLRPPHSERDFAASLHGAPVRVGCADAAVQLLSGPKPCEDFQFHRGVLPADAGSAASLAFVVDAGRLAHSAATHVDGLGPSLLALPGLGCSEALVATLARRLAHTFAGVACWPRLVLDGGERGEAPLVVDGDSYGGHAESHWQKLMPLLALRPLSVRAGDEVRVIFQASLSSGDVDASVSYAMHGELWPAELRAGGAGE